MTEREAVEKIKKNDGDCTLTGVDCADCPFIERVCSNNAVILRLANKWLADHPETPAKPAPDPRRYEIAKAVMAGFAASDNENNSYYSKQAAERAVEWADALIAELDKTEAAK